MSNLEIQDVFEPYFDGRKPAPKSGQTLEIVDVKRRHTRIARRGETVARDTRPVVARDVQPRN